MVPYYLEVLILERLQQTVDKNWLIARAANIATMPRQFSYALYVIPQDLEIHHQKRYQVALRESVNVVIVVRNASSQLTGEDARFDAGPMLTAVIQSLLGWEPSEGYEALQMTSAPEPEFDAGFGFYPLAFSTRYILSGGSQ
jgi:hypothetical protein